MTAFCQDCKCIIEEVMEASQRREPCPNCGSLKRTYEESLTSRATAGSIMNAKGYTGGMSKRKGLRFESIDGDSFSVALGRFVKLNQLVDHEAHRNVKKVVDPLTSEVLREVDEPLSKHQNRGSAKPRDP